MAESNEEVLRKSLKWAKRVVIKVGTQVLTGEHTSLNRARIAEVVESVVQLRKTGVNVVLVSSGAVGAGMEILKLNKRPKNPYELQMAASVGQARLMGIYDELFKPHDIKVGQMLLTHDGLSDRRRYLNTRNTFLELFRNEIVPIVNENDVVSTEEICFGDNDMLAAYVAVLIDADAMIILSSVPGLKDKEGEVVSFLPKVTSTAKTFVKDSVSQQLGVGGMTSKLEAADFASGAGVISVIADGTISGSLEDVIMGNQIGTLIDAERNRVLTSKKRWIAFFPKTKGNIVVDDGAARALRQKGTSLLPVGIVDVEGPFEPGVLVAITDKKGNVLAKGLTAYSSRDISQIKGLTSGKAQSKIGAQFFTEVIHRDNMILVEQKTDDSEEDKQDE